MFWLGFILGGSLGFFFGTLFVCAVQISRRIPKPSSIGSMQYPEVSEE